jgi:hypothetical protein
MITNPREIWNSLLQTRVPDCHTETITASPLYLHLYLSLFSPILIPDSYQFLGSPAITPRQNRGTSY